jgi:hypothetical protein
MIEPYGITSPRPYFSICDRTLAVVEQAIRIPEDEVVLVPEAIGDGVADLAGGEIVDRHVVGLGPEPDHLQCLPIGQPIIARRLDPGIVVRDLRRMGTNYALRCILSEFNEARQNGRTEDSPF